LKKTLFILASVICAIAFAVRADEPKGAEPKEAPVEFKSENPKYHEADVALNEARTHLGSVTSAAERVKRLEGMVAKFPDYEYRADMLYYVGINDQMLQRYDAAIAAFEGALKAEPDIAKETPILSYLTALKGRTFVQQTNVGLLVLLVVSLLLAFGQLMRVNAAIPWGRLILVYGACVAIWVAIVLVLPLVLGQPRTGLDPFPKPVLSDIALGQMGDAPLRALLWYGAGAILATLPIMVAVATIRRKTLRLLLSMLGPLAVVAAIMGLYGVRYCYNDTRYDREGHRIFFLVKNIATKEDVPDEMLHLYDKSFQQRVLASRKTNTVAGAKYVLTNCPCPRVDANAE